MVIKALNKLDFLTPLTLKDMLILVTYLNYRLKAIGRKRRRKHQYVFHPLLCAVFNNLVRKWLKPFFIKSGLETDGKLFRGNAQCICQ